MLATHSLAIARALELAKSPVTTPGWMHRPITIHLVFIAAPLAALFGALAGAVSTNALNENLQTATKHTIQLLYATAARSAAFDATQTAAAIQTCEASVASVGRHFSTFLRAFEICFEVSLGFNLVSWAVCMAWSVPHLGRMFQTLYRRRGLPRLLPARQTELRVAFLTASSTVAILTACSLAYSVEVIYAIVRKAGNENFIRKADTRQVHSQLTSSVRSKRELTIDLARSWSRCTSSHCAACHSPSSAWRGPRSRRSGSGRPGEPRRRS